MKKFLSILTVSAFLFMSSMAFAGDCSGPSCNASGNFEIDTFAIGGGLDADGALIPNGAAGGISGAGGIAAGQAQGAFESFKIFRKTINLGGADADLSTRTGGFTNTEAGQYKPDCGINIGVYSGSENFATTAGSLHVGAWGLAYSEGTLGGIAGQASLDGSIVGPSPLKQWDSKGVSLGVAGQGSVGGFIGGGIAAGLGSVDVDASVDMYGGSYTESYRGINGNTEYMGTNVSAYTTVFTYGNVDTCLIGVGFVEGGYIAAGGAATKTVQVTDSGFAKATAVGSYAGSGELNCNFNGSANGYTYTSATTAPGMNGSVMTSAAGMKVSNTQHIPN
jgi:hypothetical protein